MSFTYTISLNDPVVIYRLSGKITTEGDYEEIEKEIFDYLNQNYYRVIFDLTEFTHTNSSGIGFFMRTLTKARIMGGDLVLFNIGGNVKKIFDIAKLNEVYTICDTESAAINYFK